MCVCVCMVCGLRNLFPAIICPRVMFSGASRGQGLYSSRCMRVVDRYISSSFFVFVVDRMAFVCECVEKCTIRFAGHIALLTRFVRRPDFNPRGARLFKFLKRYVSIRLNVCVVVCWFV